MKFYASKFSKKTLRWLVLIIAMFQIDHRNVLFETSHCFFTYFSSLFCVSLFHQMQDEYKMNEGVSKAQKRPQYKSKLATLVKYT